MAKQIATFSESDDIGFDIFAVVVGVAVIVGWFLVPHPPATLAATVFTFSAASFLLLIGIPPLIPDWRSWRTVFEAAWTWSSWLLVLVVPVMFFSLLWLTSENAPPL